MKVSTTINIEINTNDKLIQVARKLGTSKSDLSDNLIKLGLLILEIEDYKNLESIERRITLLLAGNKEEQYKSSNS